MKKLIVGQDFLHSHPTMERYKEVSDDHIIVDKNDFEAIIVFFQDYPELVEKIGKPKTESKLPEDFVDFANLKRLYFPEIHTCPLCEAENAKLAKTAEAHERLTLTLELSLPGLPNKRKVAEYLRSVISSNREYYIKLIQAL